MLISVAIKKRPMITKLLARQAKHVVASVPKGRRVYAVGDIHGTVGLLSDILDRIENDLNARPPKSRSALIFLGDYIDRGPSSAAVLARLATLDIKGVDLVFLKGNHEHMMLRFLADPVAAWPQWLHAGGAPTLESYGIEPPDKDAKAKVILNTGRKLAKTLPKTVRSWLKSLKLTHREGDYMFVHAGVRPDVSLDSQSEHDLLWIRADFKNHRKQFGAIIVHGHSPKSQPVVRPNRIGIDTMAYATGILSCLVLENDQRSLLQTYAKGLHKL